MRLTAAEKREVIRDCCKPDDMIAILATVMTCYRGLGSVLAVALAVHPVTLVICGTDCLSADHAHPVDVAASELSAGCDWDQTAGHHHGSAPAPDPVPAPESCSHDLWASGPSVKIASKRQAPEPRVWLFTLTSFVAQATSNLVTSAASPAMLAAQCRVPTLRPLLTLRI